MKSFYSLPDRSLRLNPPPIRCEILNNPANSLSSQTACFVGIHTQAVMNREKYPAIPIVVGNSITVFVASYGEVRHGGVTFIDLRG